MATNDAEYQRNHKRVRKVRGQARDQGCIRCDKDGRDWAHRHGTDPSQPDNYDPMCRLCHQDYDRPEWLKEERRLKREKTEAEPAFRGWTPERREAQRKRMLEKWADPAKRAAQAERAKADQPWKGRRPRTQGGDAR